MDILNFYRKLFTENCIKYEYSYQSISTCEGSSPFDQVLLTAFVLTTLDASLFAFQVEIMFLEF